MSDILLDTSVLLCSENIVPWDSHKELVDQLNGVEKVIIHYNSKKHEDIDFFVQQMSHCVKYNISKPVSFQIFNADKKAATRIAKELQKIQKDMQMCWLAKSVLIHHESICKKFETLDSSLEKISTELNKGKP